MPYLKPRSNFKELQSLLYSKQLNGPKLAKALNCSEPTALKKLKNPGLLTLSDLAKINRSAHVPAKEIRKAIEFEEPL